VPKLKLPPENADRIVAVLNDARTVANAAKRLKVTRQALRNFINANHIELYCEWRETRAIDMQDVKE
jgi:hypothetical protein